MIKLEPVIVTWEDTTRYDNVHYIGDVKKDNIHFKPVRIKSMGFLIRENKETVCIVGEINEDMSVRDTTVIPRQNVKRITRLSVRKDKNK